MYDAQISALLSALRNNADHYGFVGENGLARLLTNAADAIEELQKAVMRLEEESGILDELPMYQQPVGWIPVTERLPEKPDHYLVHIGCKCDGELVSAWEQVAWFCGKFYWEHLHGDDVFKETITHWMPLPEPPKEAEA